MYHHTLHLTFAPCLVLRAKLRQEATAPEALPPWLDTACEYALDAARRLVGFLARSCEQNILCRVRSAPLSPQNLPCSSGG